MKYHLGRWKLPLLLLDCAKASPPRIAPLLATSSNRNCWTCVAGTRHEKDTATDFCVKMVIHELLR
jgi:hypothetical protein